MYCASNATSGDMGSDEGQIIHHDNKTLTRKLAYNLPAGDVKLALTVLSLLPLTLKIIREFWAQS